MRLRVTKNANHKKVGEWRPGKHQESVTASMGCASSAGHKPSLAASAIYLGKCSKDTARWSSLSDVQWLVSPTVMLRQL